MGVEAKEEQWKQKFPAFPYKPYSIQLDFMNSLYQFLDNGGISMLESPTGTGKTLSIICSALQWVVDRKNQQKPNLGNSCPSDDEPDWMREFVVNKENPVQEKKKIGVKSKKFTEANRRTGGVGDLFGNESGIGKNERVEKGGNGEGNDGKLLNDDDEFLVEEYESEQEEEEGGVCKRKGSISSSSDEDEEDKLDGEEEGLKVFFCSRTHSQLSQFIKELNKTVFGSELKVVSLGSRKNLCINQEVLKIGNPASINERCLELHNSKKNGGSKIKKLEPGGSVRRTKASAGCPMLRKQKLQKDFVSDVSQQEALDIEDLVDLGSRLGTCPYYGSRRMVPAADLVVLPYQSLLSKASRESLGINLKNNIIIIDEAHNLADSLIGMYDAKISLSQLENLHQCLENYLEKFRSRLGSGNRRYIQILMILTRAFMQAIFNEDETNDNVTSNAVDRATKGPNESSVTINDFLFALNIDNINFVKLINYVKESNIIHKVSGYGDKVTCLEKQIPGDSISKEGGSTLSGFRALLDMLLSLTNKNVDGRIIVSKLRSKGLSEQDGFIKYVMLTGEKIFSEIVNQAHAVVLAGGTLQPIEETRERLFPWLPSESLHFFSCGHIIPPESILPVAVSSGPSGLSFDFSYASRSSPKMIEELGLMLCNLVSVVPEGIVVFFSSFDYKDKVYGVWRTSGILNRITKKKRLFREPRSSSDIEGVLKEYKDTIDMLSNKALSESKTSLNGAVLLAVVGGKISEGINFSDGMGRCIVMAGLPYPSPSDIELIERIKHMEGIGDTKFTNTLQVSNNDTYNGGNLNSGFDILRRCKRRGKEYYENLCMKAVNQSIGRAIRHINDYAAILLVDSRYVSDPIKRSSSHTASKLPQWIQDRLISSTSNYGEVHRLLHQFFKINKNKVR
ncbi:ATP-dependent DNA helicase DDX11-like [Chenopodium quinoa]|uniref:ATP-dependent DNA helicase DDX11-like n=1 Tax=Chenopodium quinoa TaxID=63459 RepID=UPI000B76BE1A|nr:ATP-dependent DNA helicase DDX11-like [Chenopodium quinoa]